MRQRLLRWLLHYANADPPWDRQEFYRLKDELLRRHADFRGHELQEIKKDCWGDTRDDYGDWHGCSENCRRCGGTGIFDIRWVRLQKWQWGPYQFHIPDGDTRKVPDVGTVRIFGRIEHPNYGRASREAALWLFLLCGKWRVFWHTMTVSRGCGWYWWPMCNLNRIAMELNMYFRLKRCWCGKMFWTRGTGWQICRKCRKQSDAADIPF